MWHHSQMTTGKMRTADLRICGLFSEIKCRRSSVQSADPKNSNRNRVLPAVRSAIREEVIHFRRLCSS